jgi:hypothetical protein
VCWMSLSEDFLDPLCRRALKEGSGGCRHSPGLGSEGSGGCRHSPGLGSEVGLVVVVPQTTVGGYIYMGKS